jgi:CheY-like chemotaxis protein
MPSGQASSAKPEQDGAAARPASARRILVLDDHPDTARSYCELLTVMGHICEYRTDAREALDAARSLRPHIALLDIGLLPDLDGHAVARILRQEFGASICIIAITAYGRDEDRLRTRKAGFDAHVTKPIDIRLLESIVSTAH